MFLTLILFIFIFGILILALPIINGLGSYKVQIQQKQPKRQLNKPQPLNQGYVPPDQLAEAQASGKGSSKLQRLKDGLKVTKEDIPLKFRLNDDSKKTRNNVRRRKVQSLEERNDPSSFDFDIDEFNDDSDEEGEQRDLQQRSARGNDYLEEIA